MRLRSEQSSDEEQEEEISPEERAKRTAALVAPLPDTEWGQKEPFPPPAPTESLAPPPTPPLPPRAPKLTSNKYDGASSDESSEEEVEGEEGLAEEGEDEGEDGPSVVQEVDMGEEMDEFLKFATETLGLSEEQYGKILGERKSRGGESSPLQCDRERGLRLIVGFSCSVRSRTGKGEEDERRPLGVEGKIGRASCRERVS